MHIHIRVWAETHIHLHIRACIYTQVKAHYFQQYLIRKKEDNTVVLLTGTFSQSSMQCSQHYWITFFPKESVYEAENDQHFQELTTMYVPQIRKKKLRWNSNLRKMAQINENEMHYFLPIFSVQAISIVPRNIT